MSRKLLAVVVMLLMFILTSCGNKLDYSDFEDKIVRTYFQAENYSNNRYIAYYYDSSDDASEDVKAEILTFFADFTDLDYILVDTVNIETEASDFGAYNGEPIIYVVSSGNPLETYVGTTEIEQFTHLYSTIEFDYDLFADQHVDSLYDLLDIDNSNYIVYYYLDDCPHCNAVKDDFLRFAFTKSAEDIYFVNGQEVEAPENLPTELIVFNSGTPILILMSNGVFADEYYSGEDAVLGYIQDVGDGDIVASIASLDYDDFESHHIDNLDNTLTITSNLHFEYYYSPYCSHCNAIKTTILQFFLHFEDFEYYLINTSEASGLMKIDDFLGTPSLFVIYDGEVIASYVGSVQIPQFIADYENGNINFNSYQ